MKGIVHLVGAGPGDPGLLTRRGAEALAKADVVVYDRLANPRLLDLAPSSAERIYVGKQIGRCALPQDDINQLLVDRAQAGQVVVRLKGGDPFVFGRGAEEAERLRAAGIPFRVVPGVTAGVGATCCAGLPVTHRDSSSAVAFVTGHDDPERSRLDWSSLARFPGALVIYMGSSHLDSLCRTLVREGQSPSAPAAAVSSGSLPSQRVVVGTLADLPEKVKAAQLGAPVLFVIGDVVRHRPHLDWFERLPLFGQRIVLSRPAEESDRSANELEELGAEVLVAPSVRILPLIDYTEFDRVLNRLDEFDWLVFTSSNGVRHFVDRLEVLGRDLRALGHLQLAAIGPTTADTLRRFRIRADLVPDSYRSEALAAALIERAAGQRVLLARADRGRTILKDELERVAHVEQVAVYRNADAEALPDAIVQRIADGAVDWITLTSSAITQRLHDLLPEAARQRIGRDVKLASISPVTSAAAERLGWTVSAEASEYNWDGLVAAMIQAHQAETSVAEISG